MKTMKTAACGLIISNDKVLAVSRRNDNTQWGFPGGKTDPGESSLGAVIREVYEETGLVTKLWDWEQLYINICSGATPFWVMTFLCINPNLDFDSMVPEAGLSIDWKSWDELCDKSKSPFATYNEHVRSAYLSTRHGR